MSKKTLEKHLESFRNEIAKWTWFTLNSLMSKVIRFTFDSRYVQSSWDSIDIWSNDHMLKLIRFGFDSKLNENWFDSDSIALWKVIRFGFDSKCIMKVDSIRIRLHYEKWFDSDSIRNWMKIGSIRIRLKLSLVNITYLSAYQVQ